MVAKSPASRTQVADASDLIGRLAPCLHIAHQIGGRVRLKLDAAALAGLRLPSGAAARFVAALASVPGIRDVQPNLVARSCVVVYDPAVVPDAAWPDLLAGRDTAAAAALLDPLRAAAGNT